MIECEYFETTKVDVNQIFAENLSTYLPELRGLLLDDNGSIVSWDFLSAFNFKCLEQLSLSNNRHNGLINAICNMDKGLK